MMKNIGIKILSLLLLGIGLLFLEVGVRNVLLVHYFSFASDSKLNLVAAFFQTRVSLYIIGGIIILGFASLAWNWQKNAKTFGVFICVAGSNFLVQSFNTIFSSPLINIEPYDKKFPTSVVFGLVEVAIVFFIMGFFIIIRSKRKATFH